MITDLIDYDLDGINPKTGLPFNIPNRYTAGNLQLVIMRLETKVNNLKIASAMARYSGDNYTANLIDEMRVEMEGIVETIMKVVSR